MTHKQLTCCVDCMFYVEYPLEHPRPQNFNEHPETLSFTAQKAIYSTEQCDLCGTSVGGERSTLCRLR